MQRRKFSQRSRHKDAFAGPGRDRSNMTSYACAGSRCRKCYSSRRAGVIRRIERSCLRGWCGWRRRGILGAGSRWSLRWSLVEGRRAGICLDGRCILVWWLIRSFENRYRCARTVSSSDRDNFGCSGIRSWVCRCRCGYSDLCLLARTWGQIHRLGSEARGFPRVCPRVKTWRAL